jgi:hypothetical protein
MPETVKHIRDKRQRHTLKLHRRTPSQNPCALLLPFPPILKTNPIHHPKRPPALAIGLGDISQVHALRQSTICSALHSATTGRPLASPAAPACPGEASQREWKPLGEGGPVLRSASGEGESHITNSQPLSHARSEHQPPLAHHDLRYQIKTTRKLQHYLVDRSHRPVSQWLASKKKI